MDINYGAVGVCAVLSMVFGSLWYGPLFGKAWLEGNGVTAGNLTRTGAQKNAGSLYVFQFVLSLLQLLVLARFINSALDASGVETAFWVWLGFVVPTIAGLSLWNARPGETRMTIFFISAGYQLVSLLAFGYILEMWA